MLRTDLSGIVGLLVGEDIEIIDFKPPEMTFSFEKDIPITVWSPPNINIVLGFGFSATLEIALVSIFSPVSLVSLFPDFCLGYCFLGTLFYRYLTLKASGKLCKKKNR